MNKFDIAIIGGGIVGMSTAYAVTKRFPGKSVVVIDKETSLAEHQTGRNSGVLHSGIYYTPGSLKAKNCREGKLEMEAFCSEYGIPFEKTGKVIVAVSEEELPRLDNILERGQANGVTCRIIEKEELDELEPHTAGIRAIHVPETGIVDYKDVCIKLGELVKQAGGEIQLGSTVIAIRKETDAVVLETSSGALEATLVINCGGLQSDRLATMAGQDPGMKIIPFRGEYYEVKPEAQHLCRTLIYPVPDPAFPFLGVHFTRMIQGGVECGPNAVLAFAREGYTRTQVHLPDLLEILGYSGFQKIAGKFWKVGMGEMWRSFNKAAFVKALQRLVPDIRSEHLEPAPAGIRAQALRPDGSLVDDFVIAETKRIVNVCNAPSPAATAGLNIGRFIAEKLDSRLS